MNARTTAATATSAIVPAGLIIGTALVVQTITGLAAQRDHYRAEAARPRPTVTATAPAPGTEAPPHTPPGTTAPQPVASVIAASQPLGSSGSMSSQARPGTVAPSGPTPRPPPAPQQPASQCNVALAVATLNACLKLGGTR